MSIESFHPSVDELRDETQVVYVRARICASGPCRFFCTSFDSARSGRRSSTRSTAHTGQAGRLRLALSLERLEALTGRPLQRLGLSATQKPLEEAGAFLVGAGREVSLVDAGSFRGLDLQVEVPPSPLANVCSHEQWEEIYSPSPSS